LATVLTLSVSACSGQAANVTAQNVTAPNATAQKLYDQADQATNSQDLNKMLSFYDSTYVFIDQRGHRVGFAESRKQLEQWLSRTRNINSSTKIQDVKLQADRMVVSLQGELHDELHDERLGWVPQIVKVSGEDTWERKGGQWKLVLSKVSHVDTVVDPAWRASQKGQKSIQDLVDACQWNVLPCNTSCRVWGGSGPPPDPQRCSEYCERQKQLCLAPICETDLRRSYPAARSVCGS
jgi:ketosteroid isomerase-like protein